ncbi:MAG: replication-relaxation family protein [Chloroflexi bacterium]|nr:replication-relaxation family protein [Chloroflexota bacterium]
MEPTVYPTNQRLPRYRRAAGFADIRIGRPERLILEALGRFHYLSAPQLTRLLFSPSSLSYTQEHLKRLFHASYLQRLFLPTPTPFGSSPAIYTLDKKGFAYLKAGDVAPIGRFRSTEQAKREWLFLEHTLAINDFLILAERLVKATSSIGIAEMLHERTLKRNPVYVLDGKERIGIVPDCYLDLRKEKAQTCLAIEIDRSGGVERKPFQRKVRGFVEFVKGEYQQTFGTQSLTVVFVIMSGERRLREVLAWTEKELEAINEKDQADLFRFAMLDPAAADPHQVFCAPIWQRPFDSTPLALLETDSSLRTAN